MQINEHVCRAKVYGTGEWVYGYYVRCTDYLYEEGVDLIIPQTATLFPHNEISEMRTVDATTVCRSTGIQDKNGKTIFEHDYVRTQYGRICEVIWFSSPAHCGWDLIPVDRLDCSYPDESQLWSPENLEVCGNAFNEVG